MRKPQTPERVPGCAPAAELSEQRILLGEITGAHGIRGEAIVRTFTGEPEAIADYGPLTDAAGNQPLKLKVVRVTAKGVITRISGISDRNGAEALKGRMLYVARASLPAIEEEDDFYHADLIGLQARDPGGALLGEVIAVQNYGAGDLLEIRRGGSRRSELVAFTKAFVPVVDLAARCVTISVAFAAEDEEDRGMREESSEVEPGNG